MNGFVRDIEGLAVKHDDFRRVLYAARNCQLVNMALETREEIGAEVHKRDQLFRVTEQRIRRATHICHTTNSNRTAVEDCRFAMKDLAVVLMTGFPPSAML
jgi:hypothetical protein